MTSSRGKRRPPPAAARARSHARAAGPRIVRVDTPRRLVEAVPHLVGFEPHASLVLVGFEEVSGTTRIRTRCTLRLDLPSETHSVDTVMNHAWAQYFDHMIDRAAPVSVALFAWCTTEPDASAEPSRSSPATRPWSTDLGLVARAPQVLRGAAAHFRAAGVDIKDLVVVDADRFRCLDCTDPGCCPPEGHERSPHAANSFDAEAVVAGAPAPLPSRAALEARVAFRRTDVHADTENQVTQTEAARWCSATAADDGGPVSRLLDAVEGGVDVTPHELSLLLTALWFGRVRDCAVLATLRSGDIGRVRRLWESLCRIADDDWVLAPAALAALAAALEGDGAAANVALERGLVEQCTNAQYVDVPCADEQCIDGQCAVEHVQAVLYRNISAVIDAHLPPDDLRNLMLATYAEARRRVDTGDVA